LSLEQQQQQQQQQQQEGQNEDGITCIPQVMKTLSVLISLRLLPSPFPIQRQEEDEEQQEEKQQEEEGGNQRVEIMAAGALTYYLSLSLFSIQLQEPKEGQMKDGSHRVMAVVGVVVSVCMSLRLLYSIIFMRQQQQQQRQQQQRQQQREGGKQQRGMAAVVAMVSSSFVSLRLLVKKACKAALVVLAMGKGLKEEGEEEKEEKCAVCFYGMDSTDSDNPVNSPVVCGHLYHASCLQEWVNICGRKCIEPTCPTCRSPLQG